MKERTTETIVIDTKMRTDIESLIEMTMTGIEIKINTEATEEIVQTKDQMKEETTTKTEENNIENQKNQTGLKRTDITKTMRDTKMTDTPIQVTDMTNIQEKDQVITKTTEENPSIEESNTPTEKKRMTVKRVKIIPISKDQAMRDVDHQVGRANLNTKEMNDLE